MLELLRDILIEDNDSDILRRYLPRILHSLPIKDFEDISALHSSRKLRGVINKTPIKSKRLFRLIEKWNKAKKENRVLLPLDLHKMGFTPARARRVLNQMYPQEPQYVIIDDNAMFYLRRAGYPWAPTIAETEKEYGIFEKIFLRECQERGHSPTELIHAVKKARTQRIVSTFQAIKPLLRKTKRHGPQRLS